MKNKNQGTHIDWLASDEMPFGDARNLWLDMEKYRNRKEKFINWLIKVLKADTNKISDGYHTFEQLYEHRIELWMVICKDHTESWKSKKHSDGSVWDGWFILGIGTQKGKQMTYHLPIKYWKELGEVETLPKAPEYDGHTPQDVLRLLRKVWN